jgi:transcription elongation factor Elf1
MGKKKSRSVKIMKAAPPKVERVFDCPFCEHAKTVEVKLQRPQKKAMLKCRICKVPYEVKINSLMIEVDIYCQWIDECQRLEAAKRD